MAEHLARTPHMKRLPEHEAVYATFIGQAHLAGTGPAGKTCRECALWGVLMCKGGRQFIDPPGHYAASNKANGGGAEKGRLSSRHSRQSEASFPALRIGLPVLPAERKPAACGQDGAAE